MQADIVTTSVIVITSTIIVICSIGIIIASRFQIKQRKKHDELTDFVNKNKDVAFKIKDGLTKEEINKIDSEVDVNLLMQQLYSVYLELENKIKLLDTDLDDILYGNLKEFNISRINSFKSRGFVDITDGIDLINYSITEYSKNKIKFRITINCFSYKTVDNKVVSGSNLKKIEKIILLSYEKINDKWLISSYDKIYEKKLDYK